MPTDIKRRPLKMELDPTDENLLGALVVTLGRMTTALEELQEAIAAVASDVAALSRAAERTAK